MECGTTGLPDEVKQETYIIYQRVRTSDNGYSAIHGSTESYEHQTNKFSIEDYGQNHSTHTGSEDSEVTEKCLHMDMYLNSEYFIINDPGPNKHIALQAANTINPEYNNQHAAGDQLEDKHILESSQAPVEQYDMISEPLWTVDIYHDGNELVILNPSLEECKGKTNNIESSEISEVNLSENSGFELSSTNNEHELELYDRLDTKLGNNFLNDNIVDMFYDDDRLVIVDSSTDDTSIETYFANKQFPEEESGGTELFINGQFEEETPPELKIINDDDINSGCNNGANNAQIANAEQIAENVISYILESDDIIQKWNEPDEDIVEEERNCNLTYCFRDLLKHRVEFQYPREETMDIIESVQNLVELIVTKVTSNVDWLPVSRLVRVGSVEEKTSILKPDEFDYIVVIEHQGVHVERVCDDRQGHAHVTVTDPKLSTLWRKWFHDGWLKGSFKSRLLDKIRHVTTMIGPGFMKAAADKLLSNLLDGYFDTLGDAFMFEVDSVIRDTPVDELTVEYDSGKLHASKGLRKHGPGFMPTFVWESNNRKEKLEIRVDITPAIEIHIPVGLIAKDESFHKSFWDRLQQHGKIMLIPDHESDTCKPGLCFRLTFTETEISLVKDLSKHHTEVYKLLKYLFHGDKCYEFLPSYVLKTLVLKHSCYCLESENLALCVKQIVAACLHYLFNRKPGGEKMEISKIIRLIMRGLKFKLSIPSIFIKDHNILQTKNFLLTCEVFLGEIDSMLESLDEVSRKQSPDFKELKIANSHKTTAE